MKAFTAVTNILGYGSPKQIAARRALLLYQHLCCVRAEEQREFWLHGERENIQRISGRFGAKRI